MSSYRSSHAIRWRAWSPTPTRCWAQGWPSCAPNRPGPTRLRRRWLLLGAQGAALRSSTSSARFDVRRARLPRLTLDEQAELGRAFRKLTDLEAALRDTYRQGADVLRLGLEGLGAGTLRPSG